MNKIESALLAFFKNTNDKTIVVAYSGGVDSQVLLAALSTLKQQKQLTNPILVCHVNHGLSTNASAWQQFATEQCQQFELPLTIHQLALKKLPQQSLEAIARDARYQCLIETNVEPAFIVTGHHQNDQTETFLLALKRGAGLKGLSSMAQQTSLAQHSLVRPLLAISREYIVTYAQHRRLDWIEDESNEDQTFDRNFIRHTIAPELFSRWPSFNQTLSRSVGHCQDAQLLLNEIAEEDFNKVSFSSEVLSIPMLLSLSALRFNNVIRFFLAKHDKLMPSSAQLMQITQQLHANSDKNPCVQIATYCLRRYQQKLYLTDNFVDVSEWSRKIGVTLEDKKIELPDNLGNIQFSVVDGESDIVNNDFAANDSHQYIDIIAPKAEQTVSVRFSHDNPKCLPHFRDKSRALKKILQEAKIPTWQRQRIPFVYYDETLVAALGLFVCKNHIPQPEDSKLTLVWLEHK
ncbi:tRNA lysidine(34) synthetase TilS [Cognaticolwellia mytili]|uniref:tRNA lysidine(34) synthetase TilS n=1 Tax=Cognaticolwellia mytili TaxID=1888913 RepID=UPI000A177A1B|nr:tRNA lysidine(34) synthetase TilS [Cognaticolwellia mytili]